MVCGLVLFGYYRGGSGFFCFGWLGRVVGILDVRGMFLVRSFFIGGLEVRVSDYEFWYNCD